MTIQAKLAAVASVLSMMSLTVGAFAQSTGSVLYMVPTLADEYYVVQIGAAKEKAKGHPNIEWEFTAAGTNRDPVPEMIAKVEAAITRGVDVIVIDPGESAGGQIVPALNKALEAGVKVVIVAVHIPSLKNPTAEILFDDRAAALPAGKYLAEHLKAGDKIVFIRCGIGNVAMDARANGQLDGLDGSGIEVVATGDAHCDPLEGRALMENWLTAHPDLKGVLSDTDIALMGALEALRAANVDPVVVGHDGQTPALKMLAAGDTFLDATVYLPTPTFGALGVETAARLIGGEEVAKRVDIPPGGLITHENAQQYLDRIVGLAK